MPLKTCNIPFGKVHSIILPQFNIMLIQWKTTNANNGSLIGSWIFIHCVCNVNNALADDLSSEFKFCTGTVTTINICRHCSTCKACPTDAVLLHTLFTPGGEYYCMLLKAQHKPCFCKMRTAVIKLCSTHL